jgi:hypothetical protein
MPDREPIKKQFDRKLLAILLMVTLATACVGGPKNSTNRGSEAGGVGDTTMGLVEGEGKKDSAPLYGYICGGKVRIESFEEIPSSGTTPGQQFVTFTLPGELDKETNTIPLYTLYKNEYFTTTDGCTFCFDGVGTTVEDGYKVPGVLFTEWSPTTDNQAN